MPKPGLPRLTKQNMEGAPEEKWVDSVKMTVNSTVDQIELIRSERGGIDLLSDANVEQVEFDVEVPDPWINGELVNSYTGNLRYMKHPNGVVETRFQVITGAGGTIPFIFPAGYRPAHTVVGFATDKTTPGFSYASVGTNGNMTLRLDADHDGSFSFLSSDATPVPLSCWPKLIKTRFSKVSSVLVGSVSDAATTSPMPAGQVQHPVWETTTMAGEINVKLLNIAGLPYNRKSRVRLLIFGG